MFNNFSNGEKTLVIIGLIPILIVFIMIKGWFIACLWNWLMPTIFGLTTITSWQGVGIFVLCNMLFKSTGYNSSKKS